MISLLEEAKNVLDGMKHKQAQPMNICYSQTNYPADTGRIVRPSLNASDGCVFKLEEGQQETPGRFFCTPQGDEEIYEMGTYNKSRECQPATMFPPKNSALCYTQTNAEPGINNIRTILSDGCVLKKAPDNTPRFYCTPESQKKTPEPEIWAQGTFQSDFTCRVDN